MRDAMRAWALGSGAALWLAMATAGMAQATVIGTGLVSLPFDGAVNCYISNLSSKPVLVNSVKLIDELGEELPQHTTTGCSFPGAISPGLSCAQYITYTEVPPPHRDFARCEVDAKSSKSLRVTFTGTNTDGLLVGVSEGH